MSRPLYELVEVALDATISYSWALDGGEDYQLHKLAEHLKKAGIDTEKELEQALVDRGDK